MYNCVIIDDDFNSIISLKRLLSKIDNLIIDRTFNEELEAVNYLQTKEVDIIFLDIKMPNQSGLEIASIFKDKSSIIFTTNFSKFAIDGYEIGVSDYLLKPIYFERLKQAIDKAILHINVREKESIISSYQKNENTITILSNRKKYQLEVDEILYIESLKEYIKFYTTKTSILCLGSLKAAFNDLSKYNFKQIHKSYIINPKFVISYNKQSITLRNNEMLPIGRTFKFGDS